jgi:hypothetical protein
MKKTAFLWAAACALALVAPARAQDGPAVPPPHRAAIEELFAAIGAERELTAGLEAEIRAAVAAQPALADFEELMLEHARRYISWPVVREELIRLYAATYSEEEARELAAFYRTPTGRKTLAVQGALADGVRRITRERLRPHAAELRDAVLRRARSRAP